MYDVSWTDDREVTVPVAVQEAAMTIMLALKNVPILYHCEPHPHHLINTKRNNAPMRR